MVTKKISRRTRRLVSGIGIAAVLGTGAGFGITHAVVSHQAPASHAYNVVQGSHHVRPDHNRPDVPGQPDIPEPGDVPD